jgi:phosphoserine aminotransferase
MEHMTGRPAARPRVPNFSSGPCAKRPGWTPRNLHLDSLGRSHRAKPGKARLKLAIDLTRQVLEVPADYRIGIVPASDTGAVEMALWSMLGPRPVDLLAWESFGEGWVTDVVKQLKLKDARVIAAPYGELPTWRRSTRRTRDIVFTWNGTTSGVRVPDRRLDRRRPRRLHHLRRHLRAFAQSSTGRTRCVTFSWQKVWAAKRARDADPLAARRRAAESYTPPGRCQRSFA